MASLRNAIPRKAHKERSQPAARKHLGLLEKKKDYLERARDFQRKVGRIKDLKKKTLERNPDEFYFGMLSSKTTGGVHEEQRKDGLDKLTHGEIRLMKDQDLTYLQMKQSVDERRADRLQNDLHLLLDKPINSHTIFVENEQDAAAFNPAAHFGTHPKLAGRAFNRPRKQAEDIGGDEDPSAGPGGAGRVTDGVERPGEGAGGRSSGSGGSAGSLVTGAATMKQLKKIMKQREKSYKELGERLARAEKLKRLVAHKVAEKALMSAKGAKRKVKDAEEGNPAVYKWKRQRAK